MDDRARVMLRELVADHGRQVVQDPARFEALLKERMAESRGAVSVLLAAYQERVPSSLLSATGGVARESLLESLADRLKKNRAMSNTASRWAVDSWAIALGVSTDAHASVEANGAPNPDPARGSDESGIRAVERQQREAVEKLRALGILDPEELDELEQQNRDDLELLRESDEPPAPPREQSQAVTPQDLHARGRNAAIAALVFVIIELYTAFADGDDTLEVIALVQIPVLLLLAFGVYKLNRAAAVILVMVVALSNVEAVARELYWMMAFYGACFFFAIRGTQAAFERAALRSV